MDPLSLTFIAQSCSGEIRPGNAEVRVRRLCSDTRKVEPGDLFVALKGERFDGHDYLNEAAQRGAVALLVNRATPPAGLPHLPVVAVADTLAAFGAIASAYRKNYHPALVAVGGSNGKTTTKEALACVLRTRMETLWSEASFNNSIGVPQTLLRLEKQHQAAVLEVGTNHPGELAGLLQIIQPQYGIITSIGREHLEFFGDLDGVAQEEGTLAEALPANGRLFLHGDSPKIEGILARAKCPTTTVGLGEKNHWRASAVRVDAQGTTFQVTAPRPDYTGTYRTPLLGRHQAINSLLVLAVCAELGLTAQEAKDGLAQCAPTRQRFQICKVNGVTLVDDTYNANADSMLAALDTLRDLPCSGKRAAVLGDMAELGDSSREAHAEVGRRAAEAHLTTLFAVGRWAKVMTAAAHAAGLKDAQDFATIETAGPVVKAYLSPGDVVLLKASHATRLERLSEELRACFTT
jgi:UDP-N-acetylmuramoyl-tripeptide--D-alanyl-D-alanine ligase